MVDADQFTVSSSKCITPSRARRNARRLQAFKFGKEEEPE